jgi:hypothetical protein
MSFEILGSVIMRLRMMNLSLVIDLELQFGPWFVIEIIEDGLWVEF